MRRGLMVVGLVAVLAGGRSALAVEPLGREDLVSLMSRYLAALAAHDPSAVPLAEDVTLVENTRVTPIGKGLWETATAGPTEFQIHVADPVAGQVGFLGVIDEKGKPTIVAVRLKVVEGEITEIDHLVVPAGDRPLNPSMERPRPGLVEPLPPSERLGREEMLRIANTYYDAIVQDDGSVAPYRRARHRERLGVRSDGEPP